MAILLTDDFNRANSTTAPGTPTAGGPYTVRAGTWGINANQLYTSASTAASLLTFPAAVNVDFSAKLATLGGTPGLMVRYVDAANYWLASVFGGAWLLQRRIAGTNTTIATGPVAAAGDVARVVAFGGEIYLIINGKLVTQADDPWQAAATAVAGFYINSSTAARFDDASAVDATAVPGNLSAANLLTDQRIPTARETGAYIYKGRDTAILDTIGVA